METTSKGSARRFILELAIESISDYIITYNKADFEGIEKFGIQVLTSKELLKILETYRNEDIEP